MSSRDAILGAVRAGRPEAMPLDHPTFSTSPDEASREALVERFAAAVEAAAGRVVRAAGQDAASALARLHPGARAVGVSRPGLLPGGLLVNGESAPSDLAAMDLFVCEGEIGVAESGAIWVSESGLGHRAAPFLADHLAIVLGEERIVEDLHGAYAALTVEAEGFGLFIAGPSKTADIEQALVIGAHGPRALTVVLVSPARPARE